MDPIKKVPTGSIALLEKLSRAADGFQSEQVMDAALNMVVNAVRQSCETKNKAGLVWDEFATKAKSHLMECYDSSGRKKGVYPYHQIIHIPFGVLEETK